MAEYVNVVNEAGEEKSIPEELAPSYEAVGYKAPTTTPEAISLPTTATDENQVGDGIRMWSPNHATGEWVPYIVDPIDKETYEKHGWLTHTDFKDLAKSQADAAEATKDAGPIESFLSDTGLGKATNEVANAAGLITPEQYKRNTFETQAINQRFKEEHPTASAIAGWVPLAAETAFAIGTEGLGEALGLGAESALGLKGATSLAGQAGAAITRTVGRNIVQWSPSLAYNAVVDKDPVRFAEDLAFLVGTDGLLHAAGKVVGKGVEAFNSLAGDKRLAMTTLIDAIPGVSRELKESTDEFKEEFLKKLGEKVAYNKKYQDAIAKNPGVDEATLVYKLMKEHKPSDVADYIGNIKTTELANSVERWVKNAGERKSIIVDEMNELPHVPDSDTAYSQELLKSIDSIKGVEPTVKLKDILAPEELVNLEEIVDPELTIKEAKEKLQNNVDNPLWRLEDQLKKIKDDAGENANIPKGALKKLEGALDKDGIVEIKKLDQIRSEASSLVREKASMGGSDYRIAQQTKQAIDNEFERIITERAKNASNPKDRELFNLYREANKDYTHAKQIDIKELRAATNPIVNVNPFSVSHGGLGRVGHEGVALAGLILGSHLGPVGGLIGGAAGFALGKAGQVLVHKVKGKLAAYFYKQTMKGELTAAQATALATRATTQSFANKIPKIIKEISKAGGKAEVDKYFTKDHIDKLDTVKTLLGDKATGLSKSQQITALRKMIFESTDPRVLDNIKQELGSEYHDKPEALAALSSQLDKMAAALRNVFPEEPLKKPFQPAKPETFTKEQIRSINEQLAYIQNPEILLKDLADNKVQPKNVAMVAALYPSFMSRLQSEMAMQSNNVNLDSYKRLQAAYILGTQIDQNSIPAVIIQQIYDASAPQVGQQAPAPKSGKTGTKALSNGIQQYDTTFTHHPKSKA